MDQKEILNERLAILKQEASILSDKIDQIVGRLWKIRQIALTLWLAAFGVGIGAIAQGGTANLPILTISIFIPIWFSYIDAIYNGHYRRFVMREIEIRKFFSQEEYVMPSNHAQISFEKCLTDEKFPFPVYDIAGEQTFSNDGNYKWKTSILKSLTDRIPMFFYWPQILASVFFASVEYKNQSYLKSSWPPVVVAIFGMMVLYIFAEVRKKILKRSKN